jgi:hypothetical protein
MIKKLLFILFVSICLLSKGQTIHVFKPNDPNQSSVETPAHKDSMRMQDKNCIKWNWSLLARGVFQINYEIYLAGNLTAELGAGITYRDFEFEFTKTLGNSNADSIQQFNGSSSVYGTAGIGYSGEAGLRYYLSKYDNMEGMFLEATVSYRSYSFPNSTYISQEINTPSSFVPGYKFLDEQFKFGYCASHWWSDVITEFYVGVGIRNMTANAFVYTMPNYITNTPQAVGLTFKETYPQPILGFKLGFPF